MKKAFSTEELVQRWEDRREIKNLMGRYVVSFLLKRERMMFADFWAKSEDVCMGVNDGWFVGAESIQNYYEKKYLHAALVRDTLIDMFPEEAEKTNATVDEMYGIGILEDRSITNPIVEIASDGKTAKGLWCHFGSVTDVSVKGPLSNWIMAFYAVDFVRERDEWKIWHLQYLEDINSPCGANWSEGENPYPDLPDFEIMRKDEAPQPDVKVLLRERYTVHRRPTKAPPLPVPYGTFAETFSYGM